MRAWKTRRSVASLVEAGWSQAPPPVRRMMGFVEGITSRMHGVIGASRSIEKVDLPDGVRVLSVGAVSWGGDGKTPLCRHISSILSGRGLSVAILTRFSGHGARRSTRVAGGQLKDRGRDVLMWGDEAIMLASQLGDVLVWSGPDRHALLLACMDPAPDVVVIDDGLSLRGVRKDLEIALLSSGQSCFRRIPAGPLRAHVTETSRADIVGIQARHAGEDLEAEARRLLSIAGAASHPWFGFRLGPAARSSGEPAYLAAGIAHPERFEHVALEAGYEVVGTTWYPDHHVPDDSDLEDLARDASSTSARCVLVTAKDAPRFPPAVGALPIEVLDARLEIIAHEDVLEASIDEALHHQGRC